MSDSPSEGATGLGGHAGTDPFTLRLRLCLVIGTTIR